jgi:hypothetical protein
MSFRNPGYELRRIAACAHRDEREKAAREKRIADREACDACLPELAAARAEIERVTKELALSKAKLARVEALLKWPECNADYAWRHGLRAALEGKP